MIRIALVDDDQNMIEEAESYIKKYYQEDTEKYQISRFPDGRNLISGYRPVYDIIFLDIQMADLDGMKTARKIRDMDQNVILVFMTNLAKYAVRGYEVDALSFMVKPFGYGQFSVNLQKAEHLLNRIQCNRLVLHLDGDLKVLNRDEIYYVEVYDHWLIYYMEDSFYKVRGSMKKLQEQLDESVFVMCNRCYLVNLRYVKAIEGDNLFLGKYILKISRSRKKLFIEALTRYIGGSY